MGRAGARSLGIISKGCLAGSKAGAAGSLGLRSREKSPLTWQFPGLPLPWSPPPPPTWQRGGLLFSLPGHKGGLRCLHRPPSVPTPHLSFT